MNLPLNESDIAFEQFLQELPEDYDQLAREFKAFCRGRKIKTPAQLLQVVMSYCGLDQVLREVAGTFTLLEEAISDTAIHKRLKACLPWVKALLTQMMGEGVERLIKGYLRLMIIDGSTVQGPGASETWYRLHIAIDLVKLHLIHVEVTDKHQGERLDYYPLQDGDVVLIDRGYNQPAQLVEQGAKGVHVVLRYNPHSMALYDEQGQKIEWYQQLKECSEATCCVPARVVHEGECLEGWVQASRLPQEQAAQARRRVWKLIRQEVTIMISGVSQWNFERWEQCLAVMQERSRQRALQTLPDRVNRLIASCQTAGLSNI